MIAIIDLGLCNVGSVQNMLRKIGVRSLLARDPRDLSPATGVILPGVGHFGRAMQRLREVGFENALQDMVVDRKTPLLGICLGMQMLGLGSEEGEGEGLRFVRGRCIRFRPDRANIRLTIPHMGWNSVQPNEKALIARGVTAQSRFYFVHSYHIEDVAPEAIAMSTSYGYPFVSAVEEGHIAGVQFHPEKSHAFGKQVLANFARMAGHA